jgi:hypothetical protein
MTDPRPPIPFRIIAPAVASYALCGAWTAADLMRGDNPSPAVIPLASAGVALYAWALHRHHP